MSQTGTTTTVRMDEYIDETVPAEVRHSASSILFNAAAATGAVPKHDRKPKYRHTSPLFTSDESDAGKAAKGTSRKKGGKISSSKKKQFDRYTEFLSSMSPEDQLEYCWTHLVKYEEDIVKTFHSIYPAASNLPYEERFDFIDKKVDRAALLLRKWKDIKNVHLAIIPHKKVRLETMRLDAIQHNLELICRDAIEVYDKELKASLNQDTTGHATQPSAPAPDDPQDGAAAATD